MNTAAKSIEIWTTVQRQESINWRTLVVPSGAAGFSSVKSTESAQKPANIESKMNQDSDDDERGNFINASQKVSARLVESHPASARDLVGKKDTFSSEPNMMSPITYHQTLLESQPKSTFDLVG